jgi:hypothetical protein
MFNQLLDFKILFTIAKVSDQPKYATPDEWFKKSSIHTQWNLIQPSKGIDPVTGDNTDRTREYYIKQNKPDTERQMQYGLT